MTSNKILIIVFLFGLISIVLCDCVSYKTPYPKSATAIVDEKCQSEAYIIQIFNLTNKDSIQVWLENKQIDLKTMNHSDSMYFEGKTHYYFNIAVWREPNTNDYYVYSLNHEFNKYKIPKLLHKKNMSDNIELSCKYKNRTYHCTLNNTQMKSVNINACKDTLTIRTSNRISLLD